MIIQLVNCQFLLSKNVNVFYADDFKLPKIIFCCYCRETFVV